MRREGIAELPSARRAWMGPPLAALGLTSPRTCRGPLPNRCAQPSRAVLPVPPEPCGPGSLVVCDRERRARVGPSTTSRDGVAHEAPLSTVWRDFASARTQRELHASTRARLEVGAPVAQQPTTPSP